MIVETLLEKGATKVYAGVINLNSAESLIGQYGDRVEAIQIDLSKPEAITAAAKHASDVEVVLTMPVSWNRLHLWVLMRWVH